MFVVLFIFTVNNINFFKKIIPINLNCKQFVNNAFFVILS